MTSLGHGAYALASQIRAQGRNMDVDGSHLNTVADPIDAAGRYLVHANPTKVARDVDGSVRAHPYRAIAAGAAVGWIIGRFFSKK